MRVRARSLCTASVSVFTLFSLALAPASAQTPGQAPAYRAPRTADGKPNLSGIWQAVTTANWDLLDHEARQGPVFSLGASFSVPSGLGVVEGNVIPYQPSAAAKKKENAANWTTLDPEVKCYLPGVPRATYQGFPFQIVQTPGDMLIAYEFAAATRTIYMRDPGTPPNDFWMGWSKGRWEGETLVVEVTHLNDQTWFSRAGDFHSDELKVTERYTATGPDHLLYEATITDPKVFTRPWKISLPLYRRKDARAQLLDYKCVEFAEELIYGAFRKKPGK